MNRLVRLLSPLGTLLRVCLNRPRQALCAAVLLLGFCGAGYYAARQYQAHVSYRHALTALERWDFNQAHDDLAYCLQVWPTDGPTRFLAAQAARRAGRFDEADDLLRQAEAAGYPRERIVLEWALLQAQRGDLRAVEGPLLKRVADDDLDSPLILEALALGYVHVYQLPRAGRCLDLLIERQPHNVFAMMWRGQCLEGIGVQEKALEEYRKALEIDPDYDEVRLRLADRLLMRVKRYPEALEQFTILHRRQPDNAAVTIGLARCLRLLGDREQAVPLLEDILQRQPDHLGALAERGHLALEAGQFAEAEDDLRRAAAVPAPDREILHGLYQTLRQRGKTAEAAAVLARGQQMDEDVKQFTQLLKGIGANPDDASLYCRAAEICRRNGQDAEAVRWLQGALTRNPAYGPAHAALAAYYERHGDAEQAEYHRRLAARAS